MKIVLSPEIALKLETFARIYPREFSGFGFVERNGEEISVYDIVLLDVGSEVFTEIPSSKVLELMNRPDADRMKLWFHRHPINNWSGTDEDTIKNSPLGGVPELVKWSASIVLTPGLGWIGRVDSYKTNKMIVCEVEPNHLSWAKETLDAIIEAKPKIDYRSAWLGSSEDDWEGDWDDFEEDELYEEIDEEEDDDLPMAIPLAVEKIRNSRLNVSSWWRRTLGR